MLKLMVSMAIFFTASYGFAGFNPLVGTWILEKSDNPLPNGKVVEYCTGVHGMIIYTPDGFVSVALNCAPVGHGPEPADVSGRKFFYTGVYNFDGRQVTHKLMNASQPEMIDEVVTRSVQLNGPELILSGVNQGQQFSAYWRKVGL